jgi:hypothetical protein
MSQKQPTIEIPAQAISISAQSRTPATGPVHLTVGTSKIGFEAAKHLLTGKPLRRPNRIRPLGPEHRKPNQKTVEAIENTLAGKDVVDCDSADDMFGKLGI